MNSLREGNSLTMKGKKSKSILILSWVIAVLLIITACFGIFSNETYIRETPNWRTQSIGQDKINLFIIAPVLLISGMKSYYRKINYLFILCGSLLFLIYSFTIYCFDIHFNSLFLVYCMTLGISFYTFIYILYQVWLQISDDLFRVRLPVRSLRVFLFITVWIFCFLWLREDVTAILLTVPSITLTDAGLFTNPIHVLDLAIFLPGFCIVAHLLKKDNGLGKLLVPCILFFSALMDINIIALFVTNTQLTGSLLWIPGSLILFGLVSLSLLWVVFRRFNKIQLH
jgi:hypothetical protein